MKMLITKKANSFIFKPEYKGPGCYYLKETEFVKLTEFLLYMLTMKEEDTIEVEVEYEESNSH